MRKPLLFATFILSSLVPVTAQGQQAQQESLRPIRFARQPAISADGRYIAFSYQGDIWTASSGGGMARRITIHEAHDQTPAWSPDGKTIAFSSKREGNYDVYTIPAEGGTAKQWTFHTADDTVNGWSPDGKQILFASARETTRLTAIYSLNLETGATRLVTEDDITLSNAIFTPDGKSVAFSRGGSWPRKGYRGSNNGNLAIAPASGGPGTYLVREPENERWAMFSEDGKTLFYVSDKSGTANIWKRPVSSGITAAGTQITQFKSGNVFYPSLTHDGGKMVFEHDFGIWSLDTKTGVSKEIQIFAPSDDRVNNVRRQTFTTGAQEALLSPDGKQVAFIVRGEIFVIPAAGGDAKRITETPQREEDIAWSPDSKQLAFSSDRTGSAEIYTVEVETKKLKQITNAPQTAEGSPVWSPDGKTIAFVRGSNGDALCTAPAGGGETKILVSTPAISGQVWSPDGKFLAYQRTKSHSAGTIGDVFIIPSGGGAAVNATRYPGVNGRPAWSADGKKLYFTSDRNENTQLFYLTLEDPNKREEPDPADKTTPAQPPAKGPVVVKIDWADLRDRAKQVTRGDGALISYAVSPDSKSIIYSTSVLGKPDLWRVGAEGGTASRLTQTGEPAVGIHFPAENTRVVYLSSGGIRTLSLVPAPAPPTPAPIAFVARMNIDNRAELTEMFDEAWRKMRDSFYDEKMHGSDWNKIRETYRPILQDITAREDFYVLFTLVLGELNSSHVGITPPAGADGGGTGSLGVALDDSYAGPGVKVKSVMPRGPADKENARLQPGDILLKVDDEPITNNESFFRLMLDKTGKRVEVQTGPADKPKTVKIRPVSLAAYKALEYDRWTREREELTSKQSSGKLFYVHLSAMNDANLEKFRKVVYSDMEGKSGLVLDLRFNGGGSIADEMFQILETKVFSFRTQRGDPEKLTAPMPAFDKPVIVLINEQSGSNAEVFPWGFRYLKMGKIVGVPTYGGVIGTGATTLIDGTTLRIPGAGSYTMEGLNMENNGCPPDIYVENSPEDAYRDRDVQLHRAVEELLKDLK